MASAVKPLGRSCPHRVPVKPDLVGERIRAETGHFGGFSATMPSRTGSNVGSRPDSPWIPLRASRGWRGVSESAGEPTAWPEAHGRGCGTTTTSPSPRSAAPHLPAAPSPGRARVPRSGISSEVRCMERMSANGTSARVGRAESPHDPLRRERLASWRRRPPSAATTPGLLLRTKSRSWRAGHHEVCVVGFARHAPLPQSL